MKGNTARFFSTTLLTVALAGSGVAAGAAEVQHHGVGTVSPGDKTELANALVGPLRIAAGPGESTFVTQNFAGLLSSVDGNGVVMNLVERPNIEVGGVTTHGPDTYFTESVGGPGETRPLVANVSVLRNGAVTVLADLAAFETANNFDAKSEYGLQNTPQSCLDQLPPPIAPYAGPHGGEVYSHPYATALDPTGHTLFVADAGANSIFAIDLATGAVRFISLIGPVPTVLTAADAAEFGLPACTIGRTYNSEPVPTDIEVGKDGYLYVSSLPGVPEGEMAGSVLKIDPATGNGASVIVGLHTPTGLAFDDKGNLFIAELMANRISVVPAGTTKAVLFTQAVLPADVEVDSKGLLATTNVLPAPDAPPNGMLVRYGLVYGG
ncbi:ScyD/ScyE family protein [Arthrobacter crusticola]|nr:ScyD/ScyE family protein [Arthrobacter crusticola]